MCKTMINAWKLPKHHHLFNVLPTELKENLDTEKFSYEPKNMKPETATSEYKDIMDFCYSYCKVWVISRDDNKVTETSYLRMQKLKI